MRKKKITVDDAAENLHTFFSEFPWFHSVGVAGQSIHVYIKKQPRTGRMKSLLEALGIYGSNGFPVTISPISKVKPLTK